MQPTTNNIYSVLLAGSTGTRLWPVSRELYPKQLVRFIGNYSLVQSTIKRLESVIEAGNFYWNSGMFVFRADIMLDEFKKLRPALFEMMTNITSRKGLFTKKHYGELDDIPKRQNLCIFGKKTISISNPNDSSIELICVETA